MTLLIKYCIFICVGYFLFNPSPLSAQVPVSEEPMHRKVLENKYIRLLDVWMQPGDTTQFHIHETPSVFVMFTDNAIRTQEMGKEWMDDRSISGKTWYRSFSSDKQIHRVANIDSVPFHVIDIEILSPFDKENIRPNVILPFPIVFQNEKAIAYKLTGTDFNNKDIFADRPMIVEFVSGDPIIYRDLTMNKSTQLEAGQYLYIEPGTTFSLGRSGSKETLMILFGIK